MTPRVSVVMPVYNAERYLREAVTSVLNQTFDDFEFIIVDDCSKDGSWVILQEYAARDPRIRLLRNAGNLGEAGARNAGVQQARAEYVAAMDADDILFPDRLALQVQYLDSHPEVGLVAGAARRVDAQGQFLSVWNTPTEHKVICARLVFNNPLPHPTVTMRRALLEQLGWYPPVFTTDYALWWRFAQVSRLAALPQCLALIRISTAPDRISSGQAPRQLVGSQEMSLQIAQEITGGRILDEDAYRRFFMSSRGKTDALLRFDIHRLQPLWDFLAADAVYRKESAPKLLSVALKCLRTQPMEALSLLLILRVQFGITWRDMLRKYLRTNAPEPVRQLRERLTRRGVAGEIEPPPLEPGPA
ncbi:MAG: glycosyltransferase family 2 protein [Chloroflexi bacterium]|nr:glycosyltransferase family 2 protein [Chloroflexota bacterium]